MIGTRAVGIEPPLLRKLGAVTELQAVLFDMDGTIVDTEPYWIAAEYELVESFGGTWSEEHAHNLVGSALLTSAAYISEHAER